MDNQIATTPLHVEPSVRVLALYTTACDALAEAVRIDEVMAVRDNAERIKLYARQTKNNQLLADAAELKMRAERRLGEELIEAKESGQIAEGRPKKGGPGRSGPGQPPHENGSSPEQFLNRITLKEAGVDRKLSARAQDLAARPAAMFEGVVRQARDKILGGRAIVIDPGKDLNTAEKAVRRRIKEAQLAERQRELPAGQFGVILEDPEWQFVVRSDGGLDRAADNHYPTSSFEDLVARPVATMAAPDCAYFLWATVPMLHLAFRLMEARGFTPKSHWIWDKVVEGTGYWNRNRHELLLVGTRGDIPAPAPGTQLPSVMAERAREHSRKPDWSYEMIERFYPSLRKVELNARLAREGWVQWGNEAPDTAVGPETPQGSTEQSAHESAHDEILGGADRQGEAAAPVIDVAAGETEPSAVAPADPPRSEAATREDAGPAAPDLSTPESEYAALVDALAYKKGQHTILSAEPLIRASRKCDPIIHIQQLADDLGHPKGTVQGWTFKLGVTDRARLQITAQHATEVARQRQQEATP